MSLENSDRDVIDGVTHLLREHVDGWSESEEYDVENVWPKSPPTSVNDEFPRGVVDMVASTDLELSVDMDTTLREGVVRVVIWSDRQRPVQDLMDQTEDAIIQHYEEYCGDWTFREMEDASSVEQTSEDRTVERYSRSKDFVFETIKLR